MLGITRVISQELVTWCCASRYLKTHQKEIAMARLDSHPLSSSNPNGRADGTVETLTINVGEPYHDDDNGENAVVIPTSKDNPIDVVVKPTKCVICCKLIILLILTCPLVFLVVFSFAIGGSNSTGPTWVHFEMGAYNTSNGCPENPKGFGEGWVLRGRGKGFKFQSYCGFSAHPDPDPALNAPVVFCDNLVLEENGFGFCASYNGNGTNSSTSLPSYFLFVLPYCEPDGPNGCMSYVNIRSPSNGLVAHRPEDPPLYNLPALTIGIKTIESARCEL